MLVFLFLDGFIISYGDNALTNILIVQLLTRIIQ